MLGKGIPLTVDSCAHGTDELTTVTTVAGCRSRGFTFVTLCLFRIFHFLKSILNLKKVVDVECWLEARDISSWGKEGGFSAGGAA